MNRLSIFAFGLFIIIPTYVNASPAYVQGNYGESVGTSATVSLNAPVTAGSLIVVVVTDGGVNSNFSCTKGASNFTLDAHEEQLGNGLNVLSLANAAAGTTSITCTSNESTDQIRMTVLEFSGVATSSPAVDAATNTGSGLPSAGPVTTVDADSLLVFIARSDSDEYHSQPAPASGWTLVDTWGTGYNPEPDKTAIEWRVAATATNYNGSFASVPSDFSAILVAYAPLDGVEPQPSDTIPPEIPAGPAAAAVSSSQINLSWTASTDNVAVAGYRIYRGGVQIGTSETNSYSDTGLTASTPYSYTVAAFDAAGNVSAQSTSFSATTPAESSEAEDFYIAQNTSGNNTGADCTNAHSISWFNTSGNWANPKVSGKIGPGDTAHLCGTITTAISVGASGTSGSPVTVKFEDGAKMSKNTWGAGSSIITISSKSWVVIDGGTNGIIESTACGTSLAYHDSSTGVLVNGISSNIEIKNLNIPQLYVRTPSNNTDFGGSGISLNGGTLSDIRVHHNTISKADTLIFVGYENYSNIYIFNNILTHGAAGMKVANMVTGGTINNVEIYNNSINLYDDAADLSCGNTYHNDGIHFWAVAWAGGTPSYNNVNIYGNTFGPNMGSCTATTAWLFLEDRRTGVKIYNNLFLIDAANKAPTDGAIADKAGTGAQGVQIYNNTFYSPVSKGTAINMNVNNGVIKNNLFQGWALAVYTDSAPTGIVRDYNLYYNVANPDGYGGFPDDGHAVTGHPLLNGSYAPQAGSAAIDNGVDLSATFTTDYAGNVRPQGSAWDIGAYEYGGEVTPPPPPPPAKTYTLTDFTNLVADWLKNIANSPADVNLDGLINSKDLGIMMSGWLP